MSTGIFQISAPERHHPTKTLKTVQFGVSNVPGAFWGLRYRKWKVGHLGLAAYPVKLLKGGWPTTQRAHAPAALVTKPDHDLHGGPARCVHAFINTKVTVHLFVEVCTQLTCRCETSDDYVKLLYMHSHKAWKLWYARRYSIGYVYATQAFVLFIFPSILRVYAYLVKQPAATIAPLYFILPNSFLTALSFFSVSFSFMIGSPLTWSSTIGPFPLSSSTPSFSQKK